MCECLHRGVVRCSPYCPLGSCPQVRGLGVWQGLSLERCCRPARLGETDGAGQRWTRGLTSLSSQGWVLVEGMGESCCHCALPGEWV